MTSNVINFLSVKAENEIRKLESSSTMTVFDDDEDVMQFALLMSFDLIEFLREMELDVSGDPKLFRDILCMIETIKAIIYRCNKKPYIWHKVSDSIGDFDDAELPELLDEFLQKMVDIQE